MAQFIFHIGKCVHLLLLCALLRLSGELFILTALSLRVSGEISILTPLLQEIFPKLQTQSCPANLSFIAAKPYTYHGVPLSLVCLRKYVNYDPLLSYDRFRCSIFPFYMILFQAGSHWFVTSLMYLFATNIFFRTCHVSGLVVELWTRAACSCSHWYYTLVGCKDNHVTQHNKCWMAGSRGCILERARRGREGSKRSTPRRMWHLSKNL